MGNRAIEIMWYLLLVLMVVVFVGVPSYQIGVIGFFAGVGFVVSVLFVVWLLECCICYICAGKFEPFGESLTECQQQKN